MSRFTKLFTALTLIAILAAAFVFAAPKAKASDGTFTVSVYHGINGRALGLSKALPVEAHIYLNGEMLASVPLEFKDRLTTNLPAGNYIIKVFSTELGTYIPSMQVGPVDLPEGIHLFLKAKLSEDKTPILGVRVK